MTHLRDEYVDQHWRNRVGALFAAARNRFPPTVLRKSQVVSM